MSDYEIYLLAEREQRRMLAQKITDWERANGVALMPVKFDPKQPRIEQLVEDTLKLQALRRRQ